MFDAGGRENGRMSGHKNGTRMLMRARPIGEGTNPRRIPRRSGGAGLSYRDAGVDIDAGDALVERIKPLAKRTLRPEVLAGIGGFGALFEIGKRYREPVLVAGTDGVGTKLKLAFALDRHDTIGIDLVAMSVNDILVQGAEPLFFLDYFACGKLDVDVAAARHRRHRRRLRAGGLRADRRRDRRDARHVRGRRIRPRRLRRRRRREGARSSTAARSPPATPCSASRPAGRTPTASR